MINTSLYYNLSLRFSFLSNCFCFPILLLSSCHLSSSPYAYRLNKCIHLPLKLYLLKKSYCELLLLCCAGKP